MLVRQLFSRRVGYAAHALCLMAWMLPSATVPLADLARHMTLSWPRTSATYLSKVVQALVEAGILASTRGSAGGYCLARQAGDVSLLHVVCALEGPLGSRCPLTPNGPCNLRTRCGNYSALLQLQDDFSKLLSRITIEQLASGLPHAMQTAGSVSNCAHLSESSPLAQRQIGESDFNRTFPLSHLNFDTIANHLFG